MFGQIAFKSRYTTTYLLKVMPARLKRRTAVSQQSTMQIKPNYSTHTPKTNEKHLATGAPRLRSASIQQRKAMSSFAWRAFSAWEWRVPKNHDDMIRNSDIILRQTHCLITPHRLGGSMTCARVCFLICLRGARDSNKWCPG